MSVLTIANRVALGAMRTILNSWASAINTAQTNITTNTADIATNAADIATNTSDIATNTSDILTKQNKEAISTLNYGYRTSTSNYVVATGDGNTVLNITNSGATSVTVPATAGLATFRAGVVFIVVNNKDSTNDITMIEGGSTISAASFTIAAGTCATFMMTGTNTFLKIS